MARRKNALVMKDVSVEYEGQLVLDGLSLTLGKRDFFGVIGPNGGGKTTMLKAILGLIPVSKGTIRIFGEPPETGRRHLGYVPQYMHHDKDFPISVMDVVLMGRVGKRGMFRWYREQDRKIAGEALEAVEMEGFRDRQIDELSGGQRQRVFIARALATRPRMLLLDEPTASVDKHMQKSIYELLRKLNDEMAIVLVTHDIGVISTYVGRVGCLNRRLLLHDDDRTITKEMLEETYQCPVELLAHGVPHRVMEDHG